MRIYSADRALPLVGRVADVLGGPPADPMTPEWLAVPSDGMRRWLTLELARHLGASGPGRGDGVAANFVRAYPGTLRTCVLTAGRDDPDRDPWTIDRLVWPVLAVTRQAGDDPGLAALHRLPPGASRYAQARRVADLFDRYHLHRPEMVRSWSAGDDVDGSGRRVPDAASWQPHLWRLVRDEVGEPSPPERWPGLLERVAEGDLVLDLPSRLVFFGFTLLPGGGFLDLARAVARAPGRPPLPPRAVPLRLRRPPSDRPPSARRRTAAPRRRLDGRGGGPAPPAVVGSAAPGDRGAAGRCRGRRSSRGANGSRPTTGPAGPTSSVACSATSDPTPGPGEAERSRPGRPFRAVPRLLRSDPPGGGAARRAVAPAERSGLRASAKTTSWWSARPSRFSPR